MGAYSELDMERQYRDDPFADDEGGDTVAFEDDGGAEALSAFEADDAPAAAVSGTGNVLTAEPVSTAPVQPMEPPPTAPAQTTDPAPSEQPKDVAPTQPVGDKAAKDTVDEDAKRKAHEAAEAKRKAEWEAKQRKKKEAEQLALAKLEGMSDAEALSASVKRVGDDTEKLTRRNMKECVAEHIQTLCLSDPAFARKVMHPRKSMVHCIWFINRKAREFIEQEMKDNDFPKENGVYGSDVPDDLCYQWAVDYFNDPNAKEDEEKEEKFVPKPYPGKASTTPKKSSTAKAKGKGKTGDAKKADNAAPPKQKPKEESGDQISLLGVA